MKVLPVEHLMGYKPSELVGQSVYVNIHPEDLGYMKEHFHADLTQHGPKNTGCGPQEA